MYSARVYKRKMTIQSVLVCLELAILVLSGSACSKKAPGSLPTSQEQVRASQASAGAITATLNHSQFDTSTEFLLTVSNSTHEPIELPTPTQEHCYAETFWFYAKTTMGWRPKQPLGSFKCGPPLKTGDLIQNGLEKEFDLGVLLASRAIHTTEPASYVLRVRYLNPIGQEFFLFTNEFRIGPAAPIDEFYVTVKNTTSGVLGLSITNDSDQSLWLTPFCYSAELGSGWMDEKHSTLQRLTDAGSWSYIRATTDSCVLTPVEIAAGETRTIDGAKWLQDAELSLSSGLYRWDIVFYLRRTVYDELELGYHVFSDIFRYEN